MMVGDPSPCGQGAARDRQAVPRQTGDNERAFDRIQALGRDNWPGYPSGARVLAPPVERPECSVVADGKGQHLGRQPVPAVDVIRALGTGVTEQRPGDGIAVCLREELFRLLVRGHPEDTAEPGQGRGPDRASQPASRG